ncbi:MAG TPA: NAD(P)/FAD-dependent oxidoreductase [Methanocorpusculum sp.]|nr:NAD(P)/FAD-dependent oxidoreductase [Methanocorpusculum sp.]
MTSSCDILVIGAGPAGALAAKEAAFAGCSVLLVEKRPAIGMPGRCAEGIMRGDLEEFFTPDPSWISAEIDKAVFTGPDGKSVTISAKDNKTAGYTLNRKVFDRELVNAAAKAGAEVRVHTLAEPLLEEGRLTGAKLTCRGAASEVRAKVVIACDGVESQFARAAGIDTTISLKDIDTCVQYAASGIEWDKRANGFWFSRKEAPGGYIWVFSKGFGKANIGIGIPGTESPGDRGGARAKDLLDAFMQNHFPNASVLEIISGGVPVCRPLKNTAGEGLLIAGDAARVTDPLTGGGIYNAFVTGTLAGKWAAKAIAAGDTSEKFLSGYDKEWRKTRMAKDIARDWKLKEIFQKMDDHALASAMHLLKDMTLDEITIPAVLKAAVKDRIF